MDTPIINPIYIYLADVLPKTARGTIIIAVIFLIISITLIACSCEYGFPDNDEEKKMAKAGIKGMIFSVIFIILGMLIPSKETIWTMYIASKITPGTIEVSEAKVDELVDYIITKVKEIEK